MGRALAIMPGIVQSSLNAARALRLFAWAMLALWTFLGLDRPIGDGDESMHAEMLRQMIRSGDYLHTRWYGVVLHERPPLIYWLALPFAQLSSSEVAVRMSCALMSFGTLVLIYRMACRLWAQPNAALCGCILLAAVPSYHVYTRTLMSEAPYLLALTVALWGALRALEEDERHGLPLAAAGLGAAMAIKSLAAAVPLLALAPWLVWAQYRRGSLRSGLAALGIFLALAAPFFVLSYLEDPELFVREHIGFHLLQRARGGTLGMGGGLLAYASSIPLRDGPWITLLLLLIVGASAYLRLLPLLLLSSYIMLFFVAMSLVGTHLPHYILPIYPAAALAAAGVISQLQRPLYQALAPALAAVVLLASLPYSGGRDALLERPFGKILGQKARELPQDRPLYAYEWYGLALGYYADHPVVLLTAQPERFKAINFPMGAIARAHAAALVPPLPAAVGESILIAGHVSDLSQAKWFTISNILAAAPPYFLAEARIQGGTLNYAAHQH
jgi:4-amino-4-deoxy-L-arabinose transferase-like glycosyltransferase